jgi:alkylated DNA repair dioxygenase AlkB
LKLDEIFGNHYGPEATLHNHVDSDNILFSMSVALGDDCEFVIGGTDRQVCY